MNGINQYYGTVVLGGQTYVMLVNADDPSSAVLYGSGVPSGGFADFIPSSVNTSAFATCFLAGTLIATPGGERAVELLSIGDLVLTADGRAVSVKWMGRQTLVTLFRLTENLRPVRIAARALGEGLPRRDLCVTAGHAMLLDGLLVQAGALVNGTTIRRMTASELGERFTVHHIETEGHEIVLAEGASTETFVDNVTRRRFDNFAEYEALFGAETGMMDELDHPRVKSARQLPAATRTKLARLAPVLCGGEVKVA